MTVLTSTFAMKPKPRKPIRFNRRQLALMVRVADFLDPKFARKVGEPRWAIGMYADLMTEGCPPSPAILRYFSLRKERGGYVWNPR